MNDCKTIIILCTWKDCLWSCFYTILYKSAIQINLNWINVYQKWMTECVISLLTYFTSLSFWSFDAGHVTICTNRMKLHIFNVFHICRKCTKTRVSKVYRALNENLFTVTMGLNGLIKQAVTCYYYDPAPAPELKPHSVTEQSEVLMLPMGMYSLRRSYLNMLTICSLCQHERRSEYTSMIYSKV